MSTDPKVTELWKSDADYGHDYDYLPFFIDYFDYYCEYGTISFGFALNESS